MTCSAGLSAIWAELAAHPAPSLPSWSKAMGRRSRRWGVKRSPGRGPWVRGVAGGGGGSLGEQSVIPDAPVPAGPPPPASLRPASPCLLLLWVVSWVQDTCQPASGSHRNPHPPCGTIWAGNRARGVCVRMRARSRPTPQPHGPHVARQALLWVGFSKQEYWSGVPFPAPESGRRVPAKCLRPLYPSSWLLIGKAPGWGQRGVKASPGSAPGALAALTASSAQRGHLFPAYTKDLCASGGPEGTPCFLFVFAYLLLRFSSSSITGWSQKQKVFTIVLTHFTFDTIFIQKI